MYAVETTGLVKSFNGFRAVDGLELKVPEGSIYGFLGPNGAGKTTTIKMLTGLSRPTAGQIKICGQEVQFGSLRNRKDLGFLPDVPSFYDWMKPAEFLMFAGELFNMDGKALKGRIDYLLELVGLSGINKKIGGFSRGMKQRLGIAQALISDPKVIFLDEPTSALDPIGRKEVMDIISKLSGKITVFFSTHILSDIERVCDRVVILNKGKAQIEDTIDNLKQQYSRHGVVIEADEGNKLNNLVNVLRQQTWVESVPECKDGEIKVFVRSIGEAQSNIPRILYEQQVPLRRFSILEPSLEDIFLKVVNQQ